MKPVGIHHVNLMFDDIDASRASSTARRMGFDELERPDFGFPGLWFQMGAHQLHMQPGTAPDTFQHFALEVDDLDAVLEELASAGFDVDGEPDGGRRGQAGLPHRPDRQHHRAEPTRLSRMTGGARGRLAARTRPTTTRCCAATSPASRD